MQILIQICQDIKNSLLDAKENFGNEIDDI